MYYDGVIVTKIKSNYDANIGWHPFLCFMTLVFSRQTSKAYTFKNPFKLTNHL